MHVQRALLPIVGTWIGLFHVSTLLDGRNATRVASLRFRYGRHACAKVHLLPDESTSSTEYSCLMDLVPPLVIPGEIGNEVDLTRAFIAVVLHKVCLIGRYKICSSSRTS